MLLLVVALHPEAAPLIEHYRLKRDLACHSHQLFEGEETRLIVSGIGKVRAAVATSMLLLSAPESSCAVNVGTAGSLDQHPLGAAFVAHSIRDSGSGRTFHPDLFVPSDLPETEILTLDHPLRERTAGTELVDMEAAGFFEAASIFLAPSSIACLKVVSDHCRGEAFSSSRTESLIREAMPRITPYLDDMQKVTRTATILSEAETQQITSLVECAKFTASQAHMLTEKCLLFKFRGNSLSEILVQLLRNCPPPTDSGARKDLYLEACAALDQTK